jgi:tRNA-dihydrouridine synthase B
MQDEALALEIVSAVVAAAQPHGVPVTLKMRTGWCQAQKNALSIALGAQERGIAMLTIHGTHRAPPKVFDVQQWLTEHLDDHYRLYGELTGTRSARKHIGWTLKQIPGGDAFRQEMNLLDSSAAQLRRLAEWFTELAHRHERLPLLPA